MGFPIYLDLKGARHLLSDVGLDISERQIKRAAEPNARGQRKLPFFIDPIDKRLKIEKKALLDIYNHCQNQAENNALFVRSELNNIFDEPQ